MSLTERLERVERDNRRLKLAGIGVVGLMAVVCLLGAKADEVREIKARRFVIVDGLGNEKGALEFTGTGAALTRSCPVRRCSFATNVLNQAMAS